MKILLVDDEESVKWILVELFKAYGIEAHYASSCEEALGKVALESFDLILLDYLLPERDGSYFLERIQRLPNRPIVLVLTGIDLDAGTYQRLLRLGAREILHKLTPFQEILKAVEMHTGLKKAHGAHTDYTGDHPQPASWAKAKAWRSRPVSPMIQSIEDVVTQTENSSTITFTLRISAGG